MEAEKQLIYEWQYRLLGDFRTALMEAICWADKDNLELLKLGFPDEVNGYLKFTQISGWWQKVQEEAKSLDWFVDV